MLAEGSIQFLVLGAFVASGGSVIALITFWMKLGARLTTGEAAMTACNILTAKIELLRADFNDYKVIAAKEFVTEGRMSDSVDSLRREVHEMNLRLDRLIEGILNINRQP
jgi:hypothetical protein